jgi:hypothetical protein
MKHPAIDLKFGRQAFGLDPLNYHNARPGYPDWVYELLREKCGISNSSATFEIGPGTGIATRKLLDLGVNLLVAIEPDMRLADFLRDSLSDKALTVLPSTFEDATLKNKSFDLGFCATAFHWLPEDNALRKVAGLLRPHGWWVMAWNVFGDSIREDPFHEATKLLLDGPASPSMGTNNIPFALDVDSRLAALERNGCFDNIGYRADDWELNLNTGEVVALYATYSNINIRQDREAVLNALAHIVGEQFDGKVVRNMTTIVYFARRKP